MFVIERTDQGGGYLAPSGSKSSYTHNLANAQTFATYDAADAERCKGNEVVRNLQDIMPRPIR